MQQDSNKINEKKIHPFIVSSHDSGTRADIFLSKALNVSRSKVQNLIDKKEIFLNNKPLNKHGAILSENDSLTLIANTESKKDSASQVFDVPILYEDSDFLILNKPSNLIVHRANEKDLQFTLVDYLKGKGFKLSNLGDSYRQGIVHRLDKNTSGAIVVAKNNVAHKLLSSQIKSKEMGRYYLCVINQTLKKSQIIESSIMRHPKERLRYIATKNNHFNAKTAKTAFFSIPTSLKSTFNQDENHPKKEIPALIGAKLFTGRTHQIRVHLNAINRYILGDAFYGYKGQYTGRILLHAHYLHLLHPRTQKPLEIYAPIPLDMQKFIYTHFDLSCYQDPKNSELFKIPLCQIYANQF